MAFCPNQMGGNDGSLNEAQRSYAPTGRKGIAQGKAKRRPGIGMPETTQAQKGRNRRRINPCVMFRPFRALANWSGGVPRAMAYDPGWRFAPRVALRSTLGYLIMPRWGSGMMIHRARSDGLLPEPDGWE